MRLICGIVRLDGAPAEAETLARMVNALTTPGHTPHVINSVEGTAALAVLDFSPHPPRSNPRWLAADLRLDRPHALAETLGLREYAGQEELLLAALGRWGEDLPDRVDGDFALAAWDVRQRRLICARDIAGVRPLCYTHRPGQLFAFASLPRGLHASGVVTRKLDPVALGRLQFESYPSATSTGFEDISWLPAGHSLVVTPDALRLHRAWRPDPRQVGRWRGTAAEATSTLRHLIQDAVKCRLPAAGPAAAHLSGGLDSSSIVVIAAREMRARNQSLHAWSLLARTSSGSPLLDEREYVRAVHAQEPDIKLSAVHLAPLDELRVMDVDLPGGDQFAEPDDRICAAAASAGAALFLSGAGGDEAATYNGSDLLPAMLQRGRWLGLYRELKARARRQGTPMFRIAASSLVLPMLPDSLLASRQRRRGKSTTSDRRRNALSFLRPQLAEQVTAALPPGTNWESSPQDRVAMLTDSYLVGRATHWAIIGARHAVAFTYPLLDRRIIDFALSLPVERFVDGGFSRQPFRNAMAGILPESIRWRDSKFVPFPDVPERLTAALPGLLDRLRAVRESAPVASMFDVDAISATFSAALRNSPAQRLAPNEQIAPSRPLRMALHATRALILAEYVARFSA